jgi:uncharacterized membrane protein
MRRWNDVGMDRLVGGLLRAGVLASAALVLLGSLVYLLEGDNATIEAYRAFPSGLEEMRSVSEVGRQALHGHGRALIQLGVLLLIATPVAQLALSAVAFAVQGDRMYVGMTLVVLAVLAYSLFGSGPVELAPGGKREVAAGHAGQAPPSPRSPVDPARLGAGAVRH